MSNGRNGLLAAVTVASLFGFGCAAGGENTGDIAPAGGGSGSGGSPASGGTAGNEEGTPGGHGGGTAGASASAGSAGASGSAGEAGSGGIGASAGAGGSAGMPGGHGGAAGSAASGGSAGTGGGDVAFGDPCQNDWECESGRCVEGPDGDPVCSQPCTDDECPEGWRCADFASTGDPEGFCVPRFGRLCRPCNDPSDCRLANVPGESSQCIARGNEGSFCGATCSDAEACPDGYSCDVIDVGNGPTKQCVVDGGAICECRPEWAGKGYSTNCSESNGFGSCDGSRDCDTGALSDCTAETPIAEICDGNDNNCDDLTDEGELCNDSLVCTSDACDGSNGCQNDIDSGFCSINRACYAKDDANSSNACEVCDPTLSATTWTVVGNSCAIGGSCYDSGAVKSPLASCEVCDPARDATGWSVASNTCLIGSACYAPNDNRGGNAWCEVCTPGVSTTSWTQQSNTCVINGVCYGSGAANPSNPCESCAPWSSTSSWTTQANSCSIGGQCYGAGATQAGQACNTCDPTTSTTAWSLAANTCKIGGQCYGAGATKGPGEWCQACDPNQSTSGWSLTLNSCLIAGNCYTAGDTESGNVCNVCSAATPTTWSANTGNGCSDGLSCTASDVCQADGSCKGTSNDTDDVPPGTDFHDTRIGACNTWPVDDTVTGVSGVLVDGNDTDWFMARGDPGSILGVACDIDPLWSLSTNGVGVRACMFFTCRSGGSPSVTCKEGSSAATDAAVPGYSGCCETGPNPTLGATISGCTSDKTSIRFRIDNGATASCTSYSFDYHN